MKTCAATWRMLTLCLVALIASAASAQNSGPSPAALEKIRLGNAECLACHTQAGINHPPKAGMDLQKLRQALLDPQTFTGSDHGQLACTKCHTEGYTEHPHSADARDMTATCTDCHSKKSIKIEEEFSRSVHANLGEDFTCTSCHNPHVMRIASKLADPHKIVAQDNRVCLSCHDSDIAFSKFAPEQKSRPLIDEIHAWLPNTRLHWQAVRCVECHTPLSRDMLSHEILNKEKAQRNCVSCHTIDSALKVSLYRHVVEDEQQKYGFANSVILGKSYVVGATRHPLLDAVLIALAALTLGGVILHGLLRYVAARLRKRKRHE